MIMREEDIMDGLQVVTAPGRRQTDDQIVPMTFAAFRGEQIVFEGYKGGPVRYPTDRARLAWLSYCWQEQIRSGTGKPITTENQRLQLLERLNQARGLFGLPPIGELKKF